MGGKHSKQKKGDPVVILKHSDRLDNYLYVDTRRSYRRHKEKQERIRESIENLKYFGSAPSLGVKSKLSKSEQFLDTPKFEKTPAKPLSASNPHLNEKKAVVSVAGVNKENINNHAIMKQIILDVRKIKRRIGEESTRSKLLELDYELDGKLNQIERMKLEPKEKDTLRHKNSLSRKILGYKTKIATKIQTCEPPVDYVHVAEEQFTVITKRMDEIGRTIEELSNDSAVDGIQDILNQLEDWTQFVRNIKDYNDKRLISLKREYEQLIRTFSDNITYIIDNDSSVENDDEEFFDCEENLTSTPETKTSYDNEMYFNTESKKNIATHPAKSKNDLLDGNRHESAGVKQKEVSSSDLTTDKTLLTRGKSPSVGELQGRSYDNEMYFNKESNKNISTNIEKSKNSLLDGKRHEVKESVKPLEGELSSSDLTDSISKKSTDNPAELQLRNESANTTQQRIDSDDVTYKFKHYLKDVMEHRSNESLDRQTRQGEELYDNLPKYHEENSYVSEQNSNEILISRSFPKIDTFDVQSSTENYYEPIEVVEISKEEFLEAFHGNPVASHERSIKTGLNFKAEEPTEIIEEISRDVILAGIKQNGIKDVEKDIRNSDIVVTSEAKESDEEVEELTENNGNTGKKVHFSEVVLVIEDIYDYNNYSSEYTDSEEDDLNVIAVYEGSEEQDKNEQNVPVVEISRNDTGLKSLADSVSNELKTELSWNEKPAIAPKPNLTGNAQNKHYSEPEANDSLDANDKFENDEGYVQHSNTCLTEDANNNTLTTSNVELLEQNYSSVKLINSGIIESGIAQTGPKQLNTVNEIQISKGNEAKLEKSSTKYPPELPVRNSVNDNAPALNLSERIFSGTMKPSSRSDQEDSICEVVEFNNLNTVQDSIYEEIDAPSDSGYNEFDYDDIESIDEEIYLNRTDKTPPKENNIENKPAILSKSEDEYLSNVADLGERIKDASKLIDEFERSLSDVSYQSISERLYACMAEARQLKPTTYGAIEMKSNLISQSLELLDRLALSKRS